MEQLLVATTFRSNTCPPPQLNLLAYLSSARLQTLAMDLLEFLEASKIAVAQQTKSGISVKVNGKNFANIWPKRHHFVLGFFQRGNWVTKHVTDEATLDILKDYFTEQKDSEINSWNFMLGIGSENIKRTAEAIEAEGKKRGRPRKWFPKQSGHSVHRLDDDKPIEEALTLRQRRDMITDFRVLSQDKTFRERIEQITEIYAVTYQQAFEVLREEL